MASDLSQKIFKQVEYYFSDINFSKDNFLKDQSGKEDGWIAISTLLTFNRLKSLTTNESDVVDAFSNTTSEIVELNEAKDKLRRSKPLPDIDDSFKQNYKLRCVHLKGFPKEDTTLDELIEYCSQYGEIETVQMRRFEDKTFKGCCFVVYKNIESANKAISSNDKFKGEHLIELRENKETYFNRKQNTKAKKKAANKAADDENKNDENKTDEKEEEELKYEAGCIIKITGLPETISFKDIKPNLNEIANVSYVDIFPETHSAIIRFKTKNDRDIVLEKLAHDSTNGNTNGNTNGSKTDDKTENVEVENKSEKTDAKVENDAHEEDANKTENKEEETKTESAVKSAEEATETNNDNTAKMLKIKDDLIVEFTLIQGDEEREYWQKIRKFASNQNRKPNKFKKARFGNNKFNRKRPANGGDRESKKAKVDA